MNCSVQIETSQAGREGARRAEGFAKVHGPINARRVSANGRNI
jgi:hypothetical protein